MKKISIIVAAFALLTTLRVEAQMTVSGVTLPATMKVGDAATSLNGAGVRVKFFMDIYVAGLYLTSKSSSGEAASRANEPTAVKLHITSSLVSSEKMVDAIKEGFKKSTDDKLAPLQTRIDKFTRAFMAEPIVKGNEFDITYSPAAGVQISKGGKVLETIEGLDFKTALWGRWLGANPADKNLKNAMLGIKG